MGNLLQNRAFVYRQIRNPTHQLTPLPGVEGKYRVSSALFKDSRGLSLDDGELCTPEDTAARYPGCGVIAIPKVVFTEIGFPIESDPVPENPAHCIVRREISPNRLFRQLVKASRVVIPIFGYEIADGDGTDS